MILEGWEPELPESVDQSEDWPLDVLCENPVWEHVQTEEMVAEWEEADMMARALGYRDYEHYYWSPDSHVWDTPQ